VKYTVVAVGKLKESWWRDACAEYAKRMRPYATVETVEVSDRDLTHDEAKAIAKEGEDTLRAIPDGAYVVALDSGGKERDSVGFSEWLAALALEGRSHVAFVLGGAAGLAPEVLARSDARLSLGAMTLPHQMARVVLMEQLYRAHRIQRNEPYHR
jgi:23S rRNA (pseudouridine1915-N3)-methyltransferase